MQTVIRVMLILALATVLTACKAGNTEQTTQSATPAPSNQAKTKFYNMNAITDITDSLDIRAVPSDAMSVYDFPDDAEGFTNVSCYADGKIYAHKQPPMRDMALNPDNYDIIRYDIASGITTVLYESPELSPPPHHIVAFASEIFWQVTESEGDVIYRIDLLTGEKSTFRTCGKDVSASNLAASKSQLSWTELSQDGGIDTIYQYDTISKQTYAWQVGTSALEAPRLSIASRNDTVLYTRESGASVAIEGKSRDGQSVFQLLLDTKVATFSASDRLITWMTSFAPDKEAYVFDTDAEKTYRVYADDRNHDLFTVCALDQWVVLYDSSPEHKNVYLINMDTMRKYALYAADDAYLDDPYFYSFPVVSSDNTLFIRRGNSAVIVDLDKIA